ncbi:MAG TPA: hypothetical protein VF289_18075 [Brachybacterium sp.]
MNEGYLEWVATVGDMAGTPEDFQDVIDGMVAGNDTTEGGWIA